MRRVRFPSDSQILQLFPIRCLPQEIIQAVGTTISTTSPGTGLPERLEQRQREGLIQDDQRPANAFAIRRQRVQKRCFPFHDSGVSNHEIVLQANRLFS